MNHPSRLSLIFLLSLALVACSKLSGAPSVIVTNPIEHTHFDAGQTFQIKASFSDNKGLASYEVSVSNGSGNLLAEFGLNESGTLSGKSYTYQGEVHAPIGAEGTFYLHFVVIDSDGKKTDNLHEFHVDQ